ncbi:hypothetical protein DM860_013398 [Cuscuta australis]|uniref:Uncharacterized protein n=1 Tax=Cuscuta australis TaxID=267555 RepID=A0A328DTQ5_9ASTE|nr:hypothetical protein DM860_013398 [Cuscuta australis]
MAKFPQNPYSNFARDPFFIHTEMNTFSVNEKWDEVKVGRKGVAHSHWHIASLFFQTDYISMGYQSYHHQKVNIAERLNGKKKISVTIFCRLFQSQAPFRST